MSTPPFVCKRCSAALLRPHLRPARIKRVVQQPILRQYSDSLSSKLKDENAEKGTNGDADATKSPPEQGAMARRLEEATEEALMTGGRAGRQAVEDAGFSSELKERLLNKIAAAKFREEHSATLTSAGIDPSTMSKLPGYTSVGLDKPWTGEESQSDAVLRMLQDAHKPLAPGLRGKPKIQNLEPVDMRIRPNPTLSPGQKAASARERAAAYTAMGLGQSGKAVADAKSKGLSDDERSALRNEFKDRFAGPGARSGMMPSTISGLAALANERIEDAIARGQFKDIPRGKGIERDARADNPFIDTTEYIMNKMIKRQDIVPPWIEKQQELVRAAHTFRSRMRIEWRRHAAREISSMGGGVEVAMRRAREYARAEEVVNPKRRGSEQMSVAASSTDHPVMQKMREVAKEEVEDAEATVSIAAGHTSQGTGLGAPSDQALAAEDAGPGITMAQPFRDPQWEATERAYNELSIKNLNALTRSYNLLAPDLAKKPYFSLERELKACFADVAPQLADTIKERAARPAAKSLGGGGQSGSVLDRFGREFGKGAKVYDSKAPHYGIKEAWRDFWARRS